MTGVETSHLWSLHSLDVSKVLQEWAAFHVYVFRVSPWLLTYDRVCNSSLCGRWFKDLKFIKKFNQIAQQKSASSQADYTEAGKLFFN